MSDSIIVGGIIVAVWFSAVYLRVPATMLFLSILVGKLFAEQLSPDFYDFIQGVFSGSVSSQYVQLFLLLLPVFLTILFLRGTVAKSKLVINAIPLLLCVLTLALFINPYFDVVNKLDEPQRVLLTDNQGYIVSIAAGVVLLSAWLPHFRKSHDKVSKKHKHK